MFSAGIDWNEETGIRSVNCDAQKYQEEKDGNVMLDEYNFGSYGDEEEEAHDNQQGEVAAASYVDV